MAFPIAQARALPDNFKLIYSVKLGSTELGRLVTQVSQKDGRYYVESQTIAEGLASILLGGVVTEYCEFQLSNDLQVRPDTYKREKTGRGAYQISAKFAWDANQVRYESGDIIGIPSAGYVLDNCSVPYAFMTANAESLTKYPYIHIIGGDRIRHYESIEVSQETIETRFGEMDTTRIDQHRVNRPDRSLTIWVAPQYKNIAIKIVERRTSRVTTMELKSIEGL